MNNNWLSYSPHIRTNSSVNKIYLLFIIAIIPALLNGIINYGWRSLLVVIVATGVALACEIVVTLIKNKKLILIDVSSVYVGLVIGLTMPPNISLFAPLVASLVATIIVKALSGGIGQNYVSEVSVAKVLTAIMFGASYFKFINPQTGVETTNNIVSSIAGGASAKHIDVLEVLFNGISGGIGETAIIWLIVGGVFLCAAKVIDYKIPLVYLITTLGLGYLLFGFNETVVLLAGSGAILVAFFVLTDFASSPKGIVSAIMFGLGAGIITVLIWKWGNNPHLAPYYASLFVTIIYSAIKGIEINKNKERRSA